MRISEIMLSPNFGGMERIFMDYALEFAKRGHEVQVICRANFVQRQVFANLERLTLQSIPLLGRWDPLAQYRLGAAIRSYRPDVIHTHGRRAAWMAGKAARKTQVRCVGVMHNERSLDRYRYVDTLVATSEDQRQHAVRHGWPVERISVVPCFSRMPMVQALPPESAGPLRLLAYGRFSPEKGFDLLLDAFRMVLDQGVDAVLRLGGAGPEQERLQAQWRRLGFGDRVQFVGWIDDVQAALDAADLFVLPSRSESFGLVILEAMARGVSIVSTRTQGPRQVLDDETAYLVEVGSAEVLASGLMSALGNRARCRTLAQHALDRFRQFYTVEVVIPAMLRVLADQQF